MTAKPADSFVVSTNDVVAFARASGDVSPLHVDVDYARRTPFGRPVAHGALGVLFALAALPDNSRVRRISARFHAPLFPGQLYRREVIGTRVRVLDGGRAVLEAEVEYTSGAVPDVPGTSAERRTRAADVQFGDVVAGQEIPAPLLAEVPLLLDVLARAGGTALTPWHVVLLGWASYLAGMEMPGRSALVTGMTVDTGTGSPSSARAEVSSVDGGLGVLHLRGTVSGAGEPASVEVTVIARSDIPPPVSTRVAELLPPSPALRGRVALVVGGSRGLGAAIVQALVLQECTVYINFHRCDAEARALADEPGGRALLAQGDAADPEWCQELRDHIMAEQGRLDVLVLNAAPAFTALSLDMASMERIGEYVHATVALAGGMLAACVSDVAAARGTVVAVSSSAVTMAPPGWAHYVSAKHAVEGLIATAAVEHPTARYVVARPPRMLTTFTGTPLASATPPIRPEPVAATIVRTVCEGGGVGEVSVLDTFPARERPEPAVLSVVASFAADPLREVLVGWADRINLGTEVRMAPYGQVFQELLDPTSLLGNNRRGMNVVLVRPEDWRADGVAEFVAAVREHADRARVPVLICLCPPTSDRAGDTMLAAELSAIPGVRVLAGDDWRDGHPVGDHHDGHRLELAHIPYTPRAFAALGAALTRAAHAALCPPFKVLVLDCDETLWGDIAGEVGPDTVRTGDAHRAVQRWAVGLHSRGVLLCICSKNDENTVTEVFRLHPDMPLRMDHIVATRVGWNPKPDGIRALARDLDLGLDTFVFLDDNPVETAAVRAELPEVLSLTLPRDPAAVPGFLRRVWAFDQAGRTPEDRARNEYYRSRRHRNELRSTSRSFAAFIEGLDLHVDVRVASDTELPRIAQLTQRTNQFTATGRKRTEAEVRTFLADPSTSGWVTEVRDRFGDYGIVGAALGHVADGVLDVDTLVLSCRVLGRGVEHEFVSQLGRAAIAAGAETLTIRFVPTGHNTPAARFLKTVMGPSHRMPASAAATVRFEPPTGKPASVETTEPVRTSAPGSGARLSTLAWVAEDENAWLTGASPLPSTVAPDVPFSGTAAMPMAGMDIVREVFSAALRLPSHELRPDVTLEALALSSLMIIDITAALARRVGALPATLLFEHRTLGEVAAAVGMP